MSGNQTVLKPTVYECLKSILVLISDNDCFVLLLKHPRFYIFRYQFQVKTVDSTVEAGAQFQQMVNVECVTDFHTQPGKIRFLGDDCILYSKCLKSEHLRVLFSDTACHNYLRTM